MNRPASIAEAQSFDPTADVFVAMHARPAALADVDPSILSPFQRALLTIDGTVTQFIEAYAMEPVLIRVLEQATVRAEDLARWLACEEDVEVLRRRSALAGARTQNLYAYAESLLLPSRLSADIRTALNREMGGLGKILLNASLESRREALWFGMETLRDLPGELGVGNSMSCLTRTYRIIAGGEPLMLITERFPVAWAPGA